MTDLTKIPGFENGFSVFKWTAKMAGERYVESRKELLDMLLHAIEHAEFKNVEAQEFLIKAFSEMQAGKKPGKALLQQGEASGNRPREWSKLEDVYERNLSIAKCIVSCRQSKIKGSRGRLRSPKLEGCIKEACEIYGISISSAEDIYKEYKAIAEQELEYQKTGVQ